MFQCVIFGERNFMVLPSLAVSIYLELGTVDLAMKDGING